MRCCTQRSCQWISFSFGVFFLLWAILFLVFWSNITETIKYKQLSVNNNHTTEYKMWEVTPIPMYLELYLFNWTNADEVIKSNWQIKPSFEEKGPYIFDEKHYRKAVIFNKENHTVTYKTQRIWHFRPDMSNGTLDDNITTVNTILLTLGEMIKTKNKIIKMAINFILNEKQIKFTVTKPVREFIFEGYDDPLLELLQKLHLKNINIPFTKFGWFVDRNASIDYDGIYNMYDGSDNLRKLGRIVKWNYNSSTVYYSGKCGQVEGTSGELWYPIQDDPTVEIFTSDLCGTLTLTRNGSATDEVFGIQGHTFIGDESVFDNGTKYPNMACFSPGEVLRSGVRNISTCKFGAPAFVSYPHFYLADPYYRDSIEGMKPNVREHQAFIALESQTGIPVEVNIAAQVNLRVQNIGGIKLFENVKEHFIPAIWFKEYAKINEAVASQAKELLMLPSIGHYTGYTTLVLGVVLIIAFCILTFKNRRKMSDEESLLDRENS